MSPPPPRTTRRWKHPVRDCTLVVVGMVVAGVGSMIVWALTAEPGNEYDAAAEMEALVASYQPGASLGPPLATAPTPAEASGATNAWDHLLDALSAFESALGQIPPLAQPGGGAPQPVDFSLLRDGYDAEVARLPPESSPEHAPLRTWLDERRDAARAAVPVVAMSAVTRVLDRLAATPGGWRESYTVPLYTFLLPELGQSRHLARYLAARMHLAGATGDSRVVLACLDHMLAVARVLAHQGVLIDRLVAISIAQDALGELRSVVGTGAMNADDAREALAILDRQTNWPGLDLQIEGARIMAMDLVQQTHSGPGFLPGRLLHARARALLDSGGGTSPPAITNLLGLTAPNQRRTIQDLDRLHDGLLANLGLNPRQRRESGFDPVELADSLGPRQRLVRDLAAGLSIERAFLADDTHRALLALTRIRLALLIHQQLTGAYPLSLDELAPGVLPALPTDPFADDHRFRYHSDAQSFDLASVGFDGRDDAGTEADTPTDAFEPGHDGTDFVLRHAP